MQVRETLSIFYIKYADRESNLKHLLLAKGPNSNSDVWIVDGKKNLTQVAVQVASNLLRQFLVPINLKYILPCH